MLEHPQRRRDDSTHPTFALDVRPKPEKNQRYFPMLLCVEGPHRGDRFPIRQRENYVGRSSMMEIVLKDDMASRRHALIVYRNHEQPEEPPECLIEDLESRNGTEVNGQLIQSMVQMRERDRILVGSCLFGFLFRDEHEMEQEQLLYELATRDALTGLDNRYSFRTYLLQHVERSQRYERKLAMIMVDIDHFKKVNDTYGHDVGDRALIHLARVLESCSRSSEIISRWGGEEFAVLLPETGETAPQVLGERVRRAVEANPLRYNDKIITMTVSIGCASLHKTDTADTFFKRADEQLYLAKERGRNRVEYSTENA